MKGTSQRPDSLALDDPTIARMQRNERLVRADEHNGIEKSHIEGDGTWN